ncbi:MAG: hypothetical protein ACFHX7_20660 [Pseudomonadota bacterium]
MRKSLIPVLLLLTSPVFGEEAPGQAKSKRQLKVYTDVDLFAYSEPVSIERFAKDFDEPLKTGDTAFTHNHIELGVRFGEFSLGYVHRFDYVTSFSQDTAIIHHSNKNNIIISEDREYSLFLDVERLEAKGIKLGYSLQLIPQLRIDIAGTYFNQISQLQSGRAVAYGDLEPINDQLQADIDAVLATVDQGNRDLSPLLPLVADVNANVLIDYAYDKPKFDEPTYRKPNITGAPNPVISGVDFSAPSGTGYAFDISFDWQVNEKLRLGLALYDVANKFEWENAPQTKASFDLNPALLDAIAVAQEFVNGEVVRPNDIVDRHLFVDIFNADFTQELEVRADLDVAYSLGREINLLGWTPDLSVIGGYYRTDTQDFPRIGVGFDDTLQLEYDIGGKALSIAYRNRFVFARLVTDKFALGDARTFGFMVGLNYGF